MNIKSLVKKWWFWVIIVVLLAGVVANFKPKDEKVQKEYPDTIEGAIEKRVDEKFDKTTFKSVTINPNLGTPDDPNDQIVLVYLTWEQQNSESTAKQVLQLYCDDLAATLADWQEVAEVAIFWEVPYLGGNGKCSYARGGNGMYLTDIVWQLGSKSVTEKNEDYMDAMRKCTVMEAADIYVTGIGQKSDNVFNDANEGCREDYKNIYNGDEETFVSDMAIAWSSRKDEMIDGKNLEYYLSVLGW